ncbi:MAG: regulatory protein GemA [Desulfobulbaceae bacterium]|nr:regulatory protein GemA [Desulfobulbaceae bacterium]
MLDHKKLAVIHITKKELNLSDDEYRDTLEKITGVRSAKEMDDAGFYKLMRFFTRSRHYRSSRDGITLRQKMYIRHLVEDTGWDEKHFRNFLRKYYHQDDTESLSKREASKLIESLKRIITRQLEE